MVYVRCYNRSDYCCPKRPYLFSTWTAITYRCISMIHVEKALVLAIKCILPAKMSILAILSTEICSLFTKLPDLPIALHSPLHVHTSFICIQESLLNPDVANLLALIDSLSLRRSEGVLQKDWKKCGKSNELLLTCHVQSYFNPLARRFKLSSKTGSPGSSCQNGTIIMTLSTAFCSSQQNDTSFWIPF